MIERFAHGLDVREPHLFGFPLLAKAGDLLAHSGHLGFDSFKCPVGALVGFLFELTLRQFELTQAALERIDFGRDAVALHGQSRGGFVDKVDRFVWQETVGDVAVR